MYRTASTGRCAHLHDRVLNKPTNYQQRTDPRSCVRVVYIAGDTLHHQPMGAGHMTVLQLRGPMAFCVLQWCHPMLASTKRTSCCTRMITLYGARKWIQARAHYFCFITVEEEHAIQTDLFVYTRFHSRNIYISSDSKETSLQMCTHIFSVEVKMVEILIDLDW